MSSTRLLILGAVALLVTFSWWADAHAKGPELRAYLLPTRRADAAQLEKRLVEVGKSVAVREHATRARPRGRLKQTGDAPRLVNHYADRLWIG